MNLLLVTAASLAVVAVMFAATYVIGRRLGRFNVVDVTWGLSFVAVAAVAAALGDGDLTRRLLLLGMVAIWGIRLARHIYRKTAGRGEDPRYEKHLGGDTSAATVLRRIIVVQGISAWFVALPLQVSAVCGPTPASLFPAAALGVVLWLLGLTFEAVGDRQLAVFKADPANRGKIMDHGLWSWTRHPNYFGDACVWWGLWLAALAGWPSVLTVASPVMMTYFLVYGTGARVAEMHMAGRPGFADYCSRTSFFIPRPP